MSRPSSCNASRKPYTKPNLVDGVSCCRWRPCSKPLSGRQRSWCSSECGNLAFSTWDWKAARRRVFLRDKGVCCHCGLDCVHLTRLLHWIEWDNPSITGRNSYYARKANLNEAIALLGLPANFRGGDDAWQADHIVALVLGGRLCDLDNLRTLCIWCHKAETRSLAATRARGRKASARLLACLFGGG